MAQLVKKESICNAETWFDTWGWEDPLESGRANTQEFLPGEIYGLCSHGFQKSRIQIEPLSLPF